MLLDEGCEDVGILGLETVVGWASQREHLISSTSIKQIPERDTEYPWGTYMTFRVILNLHFRVNGPKSCQCDSSCMCEAVLPILFPNLFNLCKRWIRCRNTVYLGI